MFAFLHTPDSVQCVECGLYRVDGTWTSVPPVTREVISHTVCPTCKPKLLAPLRMETEFPRWSELKRLETLRALLQQEPMDRCTLREKLLSLGVTNSDEQAQYEKELAESLVERICPYCKRPIHADHATASRAGYLLHQECARDLTDSLHILSDLAPPPQHIDAYMDVARIPHGVRQGVRLAMTSDGLTTE